MTLTVTHSTTVTKPNDSEYDVSADAWNEAHQIAGTLPASDLDASSLTNNRLIYTASGLLSSTSLCTYATSGSILTVTAGAATDVPLTVKGATSQSGNLQEWQNSSGTALVSVSSLGGLSVGTLTASGSLSLPITTVSVDTTLATAHYTVLVDASGATRTITLPAASSSAGRIYNVKKIDSSANTVTIDGNASETIDGATTQVLTVQYESVTIQCNGTAWFIT